MPGQYIRGVTTASGTAGVATGTFSPVPTAGDFIIGIVWIGSSTGAISTISDGGSSWFSLPVLHNAAFSTQVFYTPSFAGSSGLVTVNLTTSSGWYLGMAEYSGNDKITAIDVSTDTGKSIGGSTALLSTSILTLNPTDTLIGLGSTNSGGALSAGNDGQGDTYTLRFSNVIAVEDVNVTTTKVYSASMTVGASTPWNMHFFALKAPASAVQAPSKFSHVSSYGSKGVKAFGNIVN